MQQHMMTGERMSLKWRALKTRSKIMLGLGLCIGLITLLALITLTVQHKLGRYYFEQACETDNGAWYRDDSERVKPEDPDDVRPNRKGRAYDIKGFDQVYGGCGSSHPISPCPKHIHHDHFVEVFVHEPAAEFLSSETGWYRYWLAPAHDSACAAFHASEKAQEHWHAWLSKENKKYREYNSRHPQCIASEKIEKPKSRYLERKRRVPDKGILGAWVTIYDDLIELRTKEVVIHHQHDTEYLGSWFDRIDAWLHDREFYTRYCLRLDFYDPEEGAFMLPVPEEPVYAEEPYL